MFAQSPVRQDVSERLGVCGLEKRAAAADEASSGNAAAAVQTTLWQQDITAFVLFFLIWECLLKG